MAIMFPDAGAQHWGKEMEVPRIDFHIEHISYADIFQRWGVNDKTVKMCTILATHKLRKFIDEEVEVIAWRYVFRKSVSEFALGCYDNFSILSIPASLENPNVQECDATDDAQSK